jgi:hypothetical protein
MPDDLTLRGEALSAPPWSSREELQRAIDKVGNSATSVRKELGK